jgi:hypothetical protein
MDQPPIELPQDRWFWVWLSIFSIVLGTSPFIIGQHPWWGSFCGVIGLGGLLVLVRDRLTAAAGRLPIRTLLKVFATVALSMLLGQLMGFDIYEHRSNLTLGVASVLVFVGGLSVVGLLSVLIYRAKLKQPPAVDQRAPIPKLVIRRADYAVGLATEVSVKDQLQNLAREGIVITVDPTLGNLLPSDPASGIRKHLYVDYSYGSDTVYQVARTERPAGEIMRLVLPEDTEVKRLTTECERLKQQHNLVVATSDKTQQENRELRDKLRQREERIEQILVVLKQAKLEADEFYADVIFSWLRDRFHSTGHFSAAALAQSLYLPEDTIRRGLGLLKSKYQLVSQQLPDVDMWTFVAGLSPLVPKYKIATAATPGATLPARVLDLCKELQGFLKDHGPEPKIEKQPSEEFQDYMDRFRSTVLPWRTQFHGDFRARFADRVANIWDEIRAKCGQTDFALDGAIARAVNSPNGEIAAVQQIIEKLWSLAREVGEDG